nr:MAG TPA: hypothetical protein [Caudoviricetes sp.]
MAQLFLKPLKNMIEKISKKKYFVFVKQEKKLTKKKKN